MSETPYEFFSRVADAGGPERTALPEGYTVELWRPSKVAWIPAGFPLYPYAVWAWFHRLGVFKSKDYCIVLIREPEGEVVHRSHVFPPYFRHPFMARTDLQVGDTFTEPSHRGKRLAEAALAYIVDVFRSERRTIWYVVHEDNVASIRVAQKVAFELVGSGVRTKRCGLRVLGVFKIVAPSCPARDVSAV